MIQTQFPCRPPEPFLRFVAGGAARLLLLVGLLWMTAHVEAQELVPVSGKRAVTWGQQSPPLIPDESIEELPAPRPDGATQFNTFPRQDPWQPDVSDLSLEQLEVVPAEPDDQAGRAGNEIIRQRYPDGRIQIRRFVIQDEFGNYLNHGPWTLYSQRGQIMARGQFEEGLMTGNWERWHPEGSGGLFSESPFGEFQGPFLSVCGFAEGQQHGTWTIMDRYRRKILEMPYVRGNRHGVATWYWPNGGNMRQAGFENGKMQGDLIEWDQNNRVTRRSSWDDNRELITRDSFYYRNQKRSENHFLGPPLQFLGKDDWWNARPARFEASGQEIQHGPAVEWYRNGQLKMRGQYREGTRHGHFAWWHPNGQKQAEGTYANGLRDGRWRWWHASGVLAIDGIYRADQPGGTWTWWFENGQVDHTEDMDAAGLEMLDDPEFDEPADLRPDDDTFTIPGPEDLSFSGDG